MPVTLERSPSMLDPSRLLARLTRPVLERIGRRRLTRRFWDRWHSGAGVDTWLAEPVVRRRVNERIGGSADAWPMAWFASGLRGAPLRRGLSLGCGEGALERDVRAKGLVEEIEGVDLSPAALQRAAAAAEGAGIGGIVYRRGDFNELELSPGRYDVVFFQQALHHVERLEPCLDQVRRSLVPGGLLYLDEYVGPSRDEWTRAALAPVRAAWEDVPRSWRRRRRVTAPVDRLDPSEAVRSSEIRAAVGERFERVAERPYGGNLVALLHPLLRSAGEGGGERAERDAVLTELLDREEPMLDPAVSYYLIGVYARGATERFAMPKDPA